MRIKIVTDSTADLPPSLAAELGIVVVPAYVHLGTTSYRDRVDIDEDEFYERLQREKGQPFTEPPTPRDFEQVYRQLAGEADAILSVHVSSRLSATCNSALRGKELAQCDVPIEIVDSGLVTMGLGLLAIALANSARSAMSLGQLRDEARKMAASISLVGFFDTVKYLAQGGRFDRAGALFASLLKVKPVLALKDGEVEAIGRVRRRADGVNALFRYACGCHDVEDAAVVYSTTPDEARAFAARVSEQVNRPVRLARLGPALGVHGGPGILFLALRSRC